MLILNGIDTKRKEKQRKRYFDDYWTFEDSKGHSVIDYSITEINSLDKINNVIIDDDIWECCNTQHRAVITEIILENNIKQEEKKKKENANGGWEVKLNRVVNKEFWEEYKKETKKNIINIKIKKITQSKDTEKSWQMTKEILYDFENMAKNLYKKNTKKKN